MANLTKLEYKSSFKMEMFGLKEKRLDDCYDIFGRIGEGGYAKILIVRNKSTVELLAMKVLKQENTERDLREVKIMQE